MASNIDISDLPVPQAAPVAAAAPDISDLPVPPTSPVVQKATAPDISDLPAPPPDYLPKTNVIQESDLDTLAQKYNVNKEDLRSLAPYYGAPVALQPGETGVAQTARAAAGYVGKEALANIPQFLYKKAQSPNMRAALDNLAAIGQKSEEAGTPGELPGEEPIRTGLQVQTQLAPMLASGGGSVGKFAAEAPEVASNLARAGKAAVGIAKSTGIGAGIGAAGAVAQSREGQEAEAAKQGTISGAKFGGALGVLGEGASFGANYARNRRLNNTEAKLAGEVSNAAEMNIEGGRQEIAQRTAPSEKILEDSILGDKTDLTPEEAHTVAREQVGPDLEKYQDPNTAEGHAIREKISDNPADYGNMPTRDAINKSLADDVLETRYKDLAERVSKTRPATLEEAQAAVENYAKGEGGPEQVVNRYQDMLAEQQREQALQESGQKTYNQPGAIGKAVNFPSASGPMFRYFGDKFGLPLEKVHTETNQAINRMSFLTGKLNSLRNAALDNANKLGVLDDLRNPEGGKIFEALQPGGDLSTLTPQEQQAAKDVQSYFSIALQEANGLSKERDVRITPLSIQQLAGGKYIPEMKLPSTEALPKIQNLLEKTQGELGVRSLADVPVADFDSLRKSNPAVDQLAQVAQMFSEKPVETPQDISNSLNQLIHSRGGANTYETRANAAMQRAGGKVPDLIRQKNIAQLMNGWAQNTARHMYLRRGVEQMASMANTMEKAGGKYEAQYVRNNIQDLLGVRQGTVPEAVRWAKTELARKMDFLIDRVGPNSVAAQPLKMIKGVPMVMDWLSSQLYNNAFFMNAKNATQHALAAYTSTAPYLGGAYGYEVVTRALPEAVMNMRNLMTQASERGYIPSALSRNLENEFTNSFASSLSRSGQKGTDAINRVGLMPLHLAVDANRALSITVGKKMAEDLAARNPGAMGALRSFSPQFRQEIVASIDRPDITGRMITDNLNSSALMHYNKLSMSAMGRVLGPSLTAFTRLPTQLWGEALYNLRTDGAVRGGWRAAQRLMGPYALLWGAQKLISSPDQMSDREKLVAGSKGLQALTPVAHLAHVIGGGALNPPVLSAARAALSPLATTDRDEMQTRIEKAADDLYRTYGPQSGLDRFLLQTVPTVITGHAPEGKTNIEKNQAGIESYRKMAK